MSEWSDIAVAAVTGAGSGTLASLLAPWAQWGVDKRRERMKRRTAIIDGARDLVATGQSMDRREILLDPRYLAIRPYLSEAVEGELRAQVLVAQRDPYGTAGNYYLGLIRDEADQLAKKWKV